MTVLEVTWGWPWFQLVSRSNQFNVSKFQLLWSTGIGSAQAQSHTKYFRWDFSHEFQGKDFFIFYRNEIFTTLIYVLVSGQIRFVFGFKNQIRFLLCTSMFTQNSDSPAFPGQISAYSSKKRYKMLKLKVVSFLMLSISGPKNLWSPVKKLRLGRGFSFLLSNFEEMFFERKSTKLCRIQNLST